MIIFELNSAKLSPTLTCGQVRESAVHFSSARSVWCNPFSLSFGNVRFMAFLSDKRVAGIFAGFRTLLPDFIERGVGLVPCCECSRLTERKS